MNNWPEHLAAKTTHARRGEIKNAFVYDVDYVLIDPQSRAGPRLFSHDRLNLASVHTKDHGGAPKQGRGLDWAQEVLQNHGFVPHPDQRILLLTQPRFLGYGFNPVSFWLVLRADTLLAVIAEVNNTFGDRHSYLCHLPDFAAITPADQITAQKIMHVSPFQSVAGNYRFTFDISPERIAIRIAFSDGPEGLIATLFGPRAPLSNKALLRATLRRPMGPLRTMALIHWQALKLKLKGARYRSRPTPPKEEIS